MQSNNYAFDIDWYEKISILKFGIIGLINQDQALLIEQKKDFLSGKIENPRFFYSGIRKDKIIELLEKHVAFLYEIETDTTHHPIVRELYFDKVNERISELKLILLISDQDIYREQNSEDEFKATFFDLNKKLYGDLSQEIFNEVLSELTVRMNRVLIKRPELDSQVNDFISTYCFNATKAVSYPHVQFSNNKLNKEIAHFKDAQAIKNYFEAALVDEHLANEWKVVIDKHNKRKTISVGYDLKRIIIPNDSHYDSNHKKFAVSSTAIQKLRVHEISTHARRKHNGLNTNLKLLGMGLAKSRQAEEGIATYREQELVTENNFFAGYLSYFAIGMVNGLDNIEKKRSFRELFIILKKLFLILHRNKDDVATELAWNRCVRIFRGTPGNITGLVLTKDSVYRAGNIKIHELLCRAPETEKWFDIGRYDPTNVKHVDALRALEIIKD